MYFKETFSTIYHELLDDIIQLEVPQEDWVDCKNCFFCLNPSLKRFNTKCCDYQPSVTNFIVGGILNDSSSDLSVGNGLLQERIKNRLGVTPFGVLPTTIYNKNFALSRENQETTTQAETTALKCSFLKQGNCTIYKYRSDRCGHAHCKSISLDHGMNFWDKTKSMNLFVDKTLSFLIAKKMGISLIPDIHKELRTFSSLIETDLGELDELKYKKLWGDWYSKEEEYYKECHSTFQAMNVQELKNELGETFVHYKSSILELVTTFRKNQVTEYLLFDEQKWEQSNSSENISSLPLAYMKLFDGKNKTTDVVKKATLMQLDLSQFIKRFLKKGYLTRCDV